MSMETAETRNYGLSSDETSKDVPVSPKIYKLDKNADELTSLNM